MYSHEIALQIISISIYFRMRNLPFALGGVSGVASFITTDEQLHHKTEAAVFSCRLCFLRAFPFISFFIFLSFFLSSSAAVD